MFYHASESLSFLSRNNISCCFYTTFSFCCVHLEAIMNNAAINIGVQKVPVFILDIYLGVELLSHMVVLCLKR